MALGTLAAPRTATAVTVALQATVSRVATTVTAAVSGAATARLASPVSVALQSELSRTATSLSVAVLADDDAPRRPVTVSWCVVAEFASEHQPRAARSACAGEPLNVWLESIEGPPPTRSVTATGRWFGKVPVAAHRTHRKGELEGANMFELQVLESPREQASDEIIAWDFNWTDRLGSGQEIPAWRRTSSRSTTAPRDNAVSGCAAVSSSAATTQTIVVQALTVGKRYRVTARATFTDGTIQDADLLLDVPH